MKRFILGTALGIASAVATNAAGWAQVQADVDDPDLFDTDEVVVSATRLGALDADELTIASSVLTETEIEARGQQYVSDLLRSMPGIAISASGSRGNLTQIRVRGAEANHVVVIIDGVEVANPSDGGFDLSGLRAQDIVRIEVLRGEQSALYGSDAVAGVINVVTRAGNTAERWQASVEGGSRGTLEGQASAVIPIGTAALSVNGNAFRTDGFDISGLGGEKDGSTSETINVGLNAVRFGGARFDAKFAHSNVNADFDSGSPLRDTSDTLEAGTTTARGDVRFKTGVIDHKIGLGHLERRTDTKSPTGTSRSVGERTTASWAAGLTRETDKFTLLGEFERETYSNSPNSVDPDGKAENDTAAIAAEYRRTLGPATLTASGRYDSNDLFDDAVTWRLGAAYDFSWEGRLRGSVGTGIKNPTLIELFGFFPASNFIGNPDLDPEKSIGVNVGYQQTIGAFEGSVDLFYSELQDEIDGFVFNGVSSVRNLERDSTRQGVELEASYTLGTVRLSGSATFLDSDQGDVEEQRRPDMLASATIDWDATDRLRLSAYADHTGSQLDSDFSTFPAPRVTLDAFTLVGARAAYAVGDHATVSLRGENLFDADYQEVFGYASPGRAVFAGLALDF
ncbi:TonB-dependent receptor [uncultured Algimonas sp.]|uniref:TonB-dependent receptor plug domain-containing protein n=1 Tax=uncultured Algimonas sp. TaxID=1547920 RepID=UPI00262EB7BF|nr:TonB-dependent receptor [uncultured Algimonas sp.]